jgi:hypothetical protein
MYTGRAWLVGLLVLLTLFGRAWGQEPVLYQPEGMNGSFTLVPEGGPAAGGPLFLNQVPAPPPPAVAGRVAGTAGGQGITTSLGNIGIGFNYLRPYWSFRDFTLAVPAAFAGSFPLLGDTGHVDNQFAFVPRLVYNYHFNDLDFDVGASGTFLNLTGRLQREVSSTSAGIGDLTASSSLTIVVANLVEVGKEVYYPDLLGKDLTPKCFQDVLVGMSIGTRYASIDQNYTGTLTNGVGNAANVATRYSTQSFKGLGLTGAVSFTLPFGSDWALVNNTRASVIIGDNRKDSSLTVSLAGQASPAATISQTKTAVVPILEHEVGIEWGMALADTIRAGDLQPVLTIRVSAVGQYWGGVGPLSAGSTQGYRASDLFLVGAQVVVGLHH